MNLLITGASGFLGSRLINGLSYLNKIYAITRNNKLTFNTQNINILNIDFSEKFIDFSFLKNIDIVIHLAGLNESQCNINYSLAKKINYEFTKELFENCLKFKVKKFIKISSIKVYGLDLNHNITENSSLKPFNNYSKFHTLSDQYLINNKHKNINTIILRLSNCYGHPFFINYKKKLNILFDFFYEANNENHININSKQDVNKNFISIIDFIKVINFFIYNFNKTDIFNIGSKDSINLLNIAEKIAFFFKSKYNKKIYINHTIKPIYIKNKKFFYNCEKMFNITNLRFDTINEDEFINMKKYLEKYD